jgi:cyclophilin family peptidyl-prolyl cis-trans isomerase/HEAT repeat protein
VAGGCRSAAPGAAAVATPAAPANVPLDRKVGWILRLEQQRAMRDADVAAATTAPSGRRLAAATTADLAALSRDPDAGVRARAVLAIGRIGAPGAGPVLVEALGDVDEGVREQAAFAMGLAGLREGVAPLVTALASDPSIKVRGRAIEAVGLIGDASAASSVAAAAAGCAAHLAPLEPDDESGPKTPEIELCRLSLFALVRLKDYDALSRVALDASGQPVARWWPVAYALQRIGDRRAVPALLTLASSAGVYPRAFALRGLAAAGERGAVPIAQAVAMDQSTDVRLRVAAVRALAELGSVESAPRILELVTAAATPRNLALEAVTATGALGDRRAFDVLVDLWSDPWPAMRAAAIAAAARVNPDGFLLVISSLDRDKDWSVRAALSTTFAGLPADRVRAAIEELCGDADVRVRGPALEALARIDAPDLTRRLFDALEAPDFTMRATAARLLGPRKPVGSVARLGTAYRRGASDATWVARAAAVSALSETGGAEAIAELRPALSDPDWPVRLRAAAALRALGQTAVPERPAPVRMPREFFESAALLHPAYTPFAFIETSRGTIEIELDVVHAPLTTHSFIELARAGFFNGVKVHRLVPHFVIQAGDPRGDGEGGPGYSIRDELSPQPFVRGVVGMALDGPDTGGSQFFITLSPQPHLDARYPVFGRVRRGLEILDLVQRGDTIDRIRIWQGQ